MPTHLRATLLALLAGLALLAPPRAAAQEAPASPARYVPPPGWRTKEFTLVRDGGWFHIFYLRENEIFGAPTQRSFGHAISRDLYTWTEQDTILPVVPDTFEATQVWAPSLHRIDGTWYLFYPGMRHEPALGYNTAQAISYATSPDLYTWTRRGAPLFDNRLFPWAYDDSTTGTGRDCRDPFLWWDATRGEWLMYVATRPASRPQSMVIGIAGSTDLEHWEDRGQMPLSLPTVSFSDVAESPHVMTRDGSLLLILWTTDAGQSLTYGRSTDPVTGWNTSRRLRSMLGYSTSGWWGSEMIRDGERSYFGVVHDGWIDLWDATWTAPDTFRLAPPDPYQLLAARVEPDRVAPGTPIDLAVVAVGATGRRAALTLTRRDGPFYAALDPATFGLPDTLTLTGDTTHVAGVAPASPNGLPYFVDFVVAAGTSVADTLFYNVPEDSTMGQGPEPEPEIPPLRVIRLARGVIRFVRPDGAAGGAFAVEVRDVRGRRLWRAEGDARTRALDWRTDGGDGPRVAPGVYFARVSVDGRAAARGVKVAVLP